MYGAADPVDDKPVLAANLMVMLLLERNGVALDRDVDFFLAESGEEADNNRCRYRLHGQEGSLR